MSRRKIKNRLREYLEKEICASEGKRVYRGLFFYLDKPTSIQANMLPGYYLLQDGGKKKYHIQINNVSRIENILGKDVLILNKSPELN